MVIKPHKKEQYTLLINDKLTKSVIDINVCVTLYITVARVVPILYKLKSYIKPYDKPHCMLKFAKCLQDVLNKFIRG